MNKLFSKESLIEHVKANSNKTFVSIHENVYDVTSFLDEHPGGNEVFKEHSIKIEFKDASEAFEDAGHSMDARDMMKKYQIGSMEHKKEKPKIVKTEKTASGNNQENSNNSFWLIITVLVAAVVLGYNSR